MCILFIYLNPDPKPGEYKVILASNRDEVFARPSKPAHKWETHQGCYGGMDMQPGKEGGTWLTINKHGRIGALLNIGQNQEINAIVQTSRRGFYAVEWVSDMSKDMKSVFESVKKRHKGCMHTFRLAIFDIFGEPKAGMLTRGPGGDEVGYQEEYLPPGIYALGNNAPGVTWNKVEEGKRGFEEIVRQNNNNGLTDREALLNQLVELLARREKYWPDPGLAAQMSGRPDEILSALSAIFVDISSYYGTRTHSIILVDSSNRAFFYERTMAGTDPGEWIENRHEFDLEPLNKHC